MRMESLSREGRCEASPEEVQPTSRRLNEQALAVCKAHYLLAIRAELGRACVGEMLSLCGAPRKPRGPRGLIKAPHDAGLWPGESSS